MRTMSSRIWVFDLVYRMLTSGGIKNLGISQIIKYIRTIIFCHITFIFNLSMEIMLVANLFNSRLTLPIKSLLKCSLISLFFLIQFGVNIYWGQREEIWQNVRWLLLKRKELLPFLPKQYVLSGIIWTSRKLLICRLTIVDRQKFLSTDTRAVAT